MSTQYKLAKDYAAKLGEDLTRVNLEEFFKAVRNEFYSEVNIEFMSYFIELAESEDFVIHHSKLVEYGIMTSTHSGHVKEKLKNLGMVTGIDFTLSDIRQREVNTCNHA